MKTVAINLSLFKLGWLAVVFSAAAGLAEVGVACVALVALVHLVRANIISSELLLLIIAALVGLTWETVLLQSGVIRYPTVEGAQNLAPYWIVAMWVLFATTLNVGMKWLRKNLYLAVLAGAVGGPMSFIAGSKIGAVELGDMAIAVIGLGWAVLLPAIAWIAAAFNGYEERSMPALEAGERS